MDKETEKKIDRFFITAIAILITMLVVNIFI